MTSTYIRQPLADIVQEMGIGWDRLGEALGLTWLSTRDMLTGKRAVNAAQREIIEGLVNRPIEECFTPEVLAKRSRKPRRQLVAV